ncbi:hypothetical protein PGH45_18430 [Legionella pneumophila]|nr:hypothetical protein [Legionella pneumophila]
MVKRIYFSVCGILFLIGYFLHHFSALYVYGLSRNYRGSHPEGLPVILTVALAIGFSAWLADMPLSENFLLWKR